MPRLFTAIELDPPVRAAVAARQWDLSRHFDESGVAPPRMVRPEQMHLTLVFLGDVAAPRVEVVEDVMAKPLPINPFEIAIDGVGVFPPSGRAQVLWFGIARGSAEVRRLFEAVARRLEDVGIPRERRPFSPHLTVGRWRERGPLRVPVRDADRSTIAVQHVSSATLFSSRLLPGGAEHTVLARAPLAGVADDVH
ncbi:MAG: RNA 2',3'-cyclic phosphodiesterase [Vicinamibacterales bacterium]